MTSVLVLGGGPDAEREVSIASASAIHQGCLDAGFEAELVIVDRPDLDEVRSWDADVVFPALHGQFGEGGALQGLLEEAGRVFVGNRSKAARLAMDKMGTKLIASRVGVLTPAACVIGSVDLHDPGRAVCPFDLPVVIKPVMEGSSVGLSICSTEDEWVEGLGQASKDIAANPGRVYMVERMAHGRELTVSVLGDEHNGLCALPIVEIAPAEGVYDFEAKYERHDTVYTVNPELPAGMERVLKDQAVHVCVAMGIEQMARVDFIGCPDGHTTMLEVNTMPGFTPTSLYPMSAKASGRSMGQLCSHLVRCAIHNADGVQTRR